MPSLIMLVGPPGSGKSTIAKDLINNGGDRGAATVYVNQDSQGKEGHKEIFRDAINEDRNIILDRMNFNVHQRHLYLTEAKSRGYKTKIIVLHENYETCLKRMLKRENHETIKDETSARSALRLFFGKYERPQEEEADLIEFKYPIGYKPIALYSDLDGTLCNVEHRRHHVRPDPSKMYSIGSCDSADMVNSLPKFKKNWKAFFEGMSNDTVNMPVMEVIRRFAHSHQIVYCTGRPDNYAKQTKEWLEKHNAPQGSMFMRARNDSREDSVIKEILLDFEILTRFSVDFCLDDRDQVVKMLRNRGLTVFQVAEGNF